MALNSVHIILRGCSHRALGSFLDVREYLGRDAVVILSGTLCR
jgi:hypothetical protein